MKLASHLKRSPCGVYYFRLVIPRRLRSAHGGKREIKRSLGTKDPAVARRLAYILSAGANPWLNGSESDPAMASNKKKIKTEREENIELLLRERERAINDYNLRLQPDYPGQMNYMWGGAEAPRRELYWYKEVTNLLNFIAKIEEQLRAWGEEPPPAKLVGSIPGIFSDAAIPVTKIAPVATVGQTGPSTQTAGSHNPPVADPALQTRLSGGISAHLEMAKRSALAEKTRMAVEKALSRFQSWIKSTASNPNSVPKVAGVPIPLLEADPLLTAIDAVHIVAYMDHMLANEFAGRGGAATNPVKNGREEKRGLSKATVHKEMGFLNGLFRAMQRRKSFPENRALPTEGISPYSQGEKMRSVSDTRYLSFTSRDLARIFEPGALQSTGKPHEFWAPLLGLYTGARINEICQLRLVDVQQHGEFLAIDIRHTAQTRTKNRSSERLIPLHKELLALGFKEYVEDVRKVAGDDARLFPYLLQTVNGYSKVPSRAFSEYLEKVGVKAARKSFHSLRGTLNEAFLRAFIAEEERSQVLGHSRRSMNVTHVGADRKLTTFSG